MITALWIWLGSSVLFAAGFALGALLTKCKIEDERRSAELRRRLTERTAENAAARIARLRAGVSL